MISKILRSSALVVLGIASLSLIAPASLRAQVTSSLVTNRLTQPIDDNSRITLKGNVHPLASLANDRGAVPDSMPLDRLQIVLKRSAGQESALQQLIHDQHTPGTANYHKWLTPAQFGQQFGPSDQDVATIEAWLASKGFNVEKVDPGKQTLEFSGNAAQFRSAFSAPIHKYVVNGETHYANAGDPQIPAALAPVVGGFTSLNNFRPHSFAKVLGHATYDPKTGQATPQWTYGTPSGFNFPVSPGDFDIQYDVPTTTLNGSGQTIAIINESNINIALVNQFRTLFGLPPNPPQIIIEGNDPGVDGINNPDGPNYASTEAYLDVEEAGAVAPGATIDLVIGADTALSDGLLLAAEHAVNGNIAPIISMSFGLGCEAVLGTSNNQFVNALWEQAAAQGQTVLISTGDDASAGCDDDNSQYYAVGGAAVSGLASTPFNVAVGGTDFYYSSWNQGTTAIDNQLATYWSTTPTQNPTTSIKGFIPEQPWNNSQYGLNLVNILTQSNGQQTSIAGGSGGESTVYSKPVWQTGTGVPSDSHRDIPDVSLFAANGLNASYYPICAVDGDCQPASSGNLVQITGVGGTSASTPAFAGIMALVDQQYGRQGQANYVLYALASQYPSAFHDVTNGTNSVPCNLDTVVDQTTGAVVAPLDCIAVSGGPTVTDPTFGASVEGQIGSGSTPEYNATTGYDLATGLGSVDAAKLIADWGSVQFTSTTVDLTSPTAGSFAHGQSVTFSGTVTGTGKTTPSGDVAIETDSTEPTMQGQGFATLSNGTFSSAMTTLPGGTYDVWANYGGDASNASAQSQKTQITVTPEASNIYFAVDDVATGRTSAGAAISSGATVPYGTQLMLSAQVVPSSVFSTFPACESAATNPCVFTPPTGTIAFSDNGSALNTAVINGSGDAEYNAAFIPGAHSVTASFNGDRSYNASSASAIAFTVAKDTPTINAIALTSQSGALPQGQSNAITIQVLNSANANNETATNLSYSVPAVAPTGTVTISGLPSGVPTSVTLQPSVDPQTSFPVGIATITLPASASGSPTATFTYSGDSNYNTATASQQFPLQSFGGVASSITASISGTISPTTNVTLSGTVTGQSGNKAPSNGFGGIYVLSNGYYFQISVVPGTGDTSTFSATLNSQSLLQGSNTITVQYLGDSIYAPSAYTLTTAISNPLSDFTMIPNTTIVPVTVGTAATDTIQLAPVNGFSNSVTFTCTAPTGITCSLNPSSYAFSGGASTATLSLSATSAAADGSANILVTGTDSSGKYVHTLAIQAEVSGATAAAPDFSVNGSPASFTISPGATTGNTTGISVMPSGGFTGNVDLTATVTSSPSGATSAPTLTLSPTTLGITGQSAISSILSVASTSSTTTGDYTITVTGTSGGTSHTATLNLTITSTPPSFTLASSPGSLTLTAGATTGNTTAINATPANGFTGSINFTCAVTSAPAGAVDSPSCSAPAANVTGTAAVSSTLTVDSTARTNGALSRPANPLDKLVAAGGGAVLAALLFFGIPARRRNWRSILAVLVFAGIVGMGIGCGSGGSNNNNSGGGGGTTGTTAGSYVLTVTGTDAATGKITATTTVNLTVQ